MTSNLHHEMELVVAIGKGGKDIAEADALSHVWGYAAGLDMTRRDLAERRREEGKPWDMGKGFDQSAPIRRPRPASAFPDPTKGKIELKVNGAVRQVSRPLQAHLVRRRDHRLPLAPASNSPPVT
jgi:fumarylpyruvate hydrolase